MEGENLIVAAIAFVVLFFIFLGLREYLITFAEPNVVNLMTIIFIVIVIYFLVSLL